MAILENSVFSQLIVIDFTSEVSKYTSVALTVLLILLVIYLMVIHNSKSIFEHNITNLTDQIDIQVSHYEALNAHENEMRRFRHDYANMILCLKVILQTDDAQQALTFIEDMEDSFDYTKPGFDSGNYIADALLSEKAHKAEQYNIGLNFDGFIPSYRITNLDLCIILSNALDNAIEACAKIDGEKTIEIVSEIKNGIWFLTMKNPVARKVSIQNNTVFTTKSDASKHGFGLYNIERTVKKGGGHIKLSCSNHTFELETAMKLNTAK